MKTLIALFLLLAVSAFAANPDYKVFRGAGGITIVSNPPQGTIIIDGSGVFTSGTNSTIAIKTNGVAVSNTAMTNNFTAGNNMVLKGTNTSGTAHIAFGVASNLTFNSSLGSLVLGTWDGVFGFSNATVGALSLVMNSPDTDTDWQILGALTASNMTILGLAGTGTNVGIDPSGNLFRTTVAGGTGNAISNANVLFVDTGGNNSTAVRGRRDLPYLTPVAAVSAAVAGDTVVCFPGNYVNATNLFKNGVNLLGYPGAWLSYTNRTNDRGVGILDDRWAGSGGVTSVIYGFSLRHSCGINTTNAAQNGPGLGPTNIVGTFVVTNPLSFVQFTFDRIEFDQFTVGNEAAVLSLFNGRGFVRGNEIVDIGLNTRRVIGFDPEFSEDVTAASDTIGTWWQSGEWHVDVKRNITSKYGMYMHAPTTNDVGNFWYTGDYCFGKIYAATATLNPNWKSWVKIKELQNTNGASCSLLSVGTGMGKFYLTFDKLGSSGQAFDMDGGLEVWLTAQKVSGRTGWLDVPEGILHAQVQHFEDTGAVDRGIYVRGGTLELSGLTCTVTNVTGSAVEFVSGAAAIAGMRMSTVNSTNSPVVVGTNGLVLAHSTLLAGSGSFSVQSRTNITATNQTVNLQSVVMNKSLTNSITGLVGPWTVDANVR